MYEYRAGGNCANDYEKIRVLHFRACYWMPVHKKSAERSGNLRSRDS